MSAPHQRPLPGIGGRGPRWHATRREILAAEVKLLDARYALHAIATSKGSATQLRALAIAALEQLTGKALRSPEQRKCDRQTAAFTSHGDPAVPAFTGHSKGAPPGAYPPESPDGEDST